MDDYFIGAGALLTSGPEGTIASASFHAQIDPLLSPVARAVAVDFEGSSQASLERLLVCGSGCSASRFSAAFLDPLRARGDAALSDVVVALAQAMRTGVVHLFARWLPSAELCAELESRGVTLIALPLEAIRRGALVAGQRRRGFTTSLRAA